MKRISIIAALLCAMSSPGQMGGACRAFAAEPAGFTDLNSVQSVDMIKNNKDILILDVRSVKEQTTKHEFLKGATMIPEGELAGRLSEIEAYRHKKIVVACPCGIRSRRASELLVKNGFDQVFNISPPGIPGMARVQGAPIEFR